MTEAATNIPVSEATSTTTAAATPTKGADTPSAHWDWWGPFESWRREAERAYGELQRGPWRLPFTRTAFDVSPVWPGEFMWRATPAVEIVEGEQGYVITAEIPGIPANNVEISLSDDRLTIAGEKTEEKEEHRKDVHLSERRYGSFQRTFRLPADVERSKISAQFSNGILTVTLPKSAEAHQSERKIDVQAAA